MPRTVDQILRGTPLAPYIQQFKKAGRRWGVNPALLAAIAGAESSFGQHESGQFNPFGMGPGLNYGSYAEAANAAARNLRKNYLNQGLTSVAAIGSKWAPGGAANDPTNLNSNWARNVKGFLGGSINAGGGASGSAATGPAPTPAGDTAGTTIPGLALSAIADISSGQRYDPLRQLGELASLARTPAVTASGGPTRTGGASVKLRPGGGWGGTKNLAYQLSRGLGLKSVSEKRDRKNTSSGGVSDHWTGSKNAYARDLGGTTEQMNRAAMILSRRLHLGWDGHGPLIATVKRGRYRYQIIWNTPLYGGHLDHIHIGVRRV